MVDGVNQQPGLFQRIGNFFGGDDPNAGQPTDPFAGLSRPQRTMLGFAALRDAAASLEGRDSNFFQSAMGGFEQARERERLRAQGIFANQVQALQAIGQIENEIGLLRDQGLEPTQAQLRLRDLLYSSVEGQMPSLANVGRDAVQPAPSPGAMSAEEFQGTMSIQPGGSSDISGRPTGAYTGEPEVAPNGGVVEPTAPVNEIDRLQQEVADLDQRISLIVAQRGDPRALESQRDRKLSEIETRTAAAIEADTARLAGEDKARQAGHYINIIESVMNDPALEGVVGYIEGQFDPQAGIGRRVFGEDERNVIAKLNQLGGAAFLQAFESLKGGGQITQIEGEKATEAITRIGERGVSPEAYRGALEELRQVYANAQARARGEELPFPEINVGQAAPATGGATHRYNPTTQQIEAIQ